jgi:hypothetical protein
MEYYIAERYSGRAWRDGIGKRREEGIKNATRKAAMAERTIAN